MAASSSPISLAFVLLSCCAPAPHSAAVVLTAGTVAGPAAALCEARCLREARCARASACACDTISDRHVVRDDWLRADAACLARAPCDAPALEETETAEPACERVAYASIGVGGIAWPGVVLRCLAKGDTCGGSFDACRHLAALVDSARAEVDACFARPCDEYEACFAAFWSARVAPTVPAWPVWRRSTR
jgi:hypothetical protein